MKYIIILSLITNILLSHEHMTDTRSHAEFLEDRYNVVKKRVNEDIYRNNRAYDRNKQDSYYYYNSNNDNFRRHINFNKYTNLANITKGTKEITFNAHLSSPKGLEATLLHYIDTNVGVGLNLHYIDDDSDSNIGPKISYNMPLLNNFSIKLNLKFLYDGDLMPGVSSDFNYFISKQTALFFKVGYLKKTSSDYDTNLGIGISFYLDDTL